MYVHATTKAVTRGRTNHFGNILADREFWLAVGCYLFDVSNSLTSEYDLDNVEMNQRAKYRGSEMISFENYCPDTQTHPERIDCCTWPLKWSLKLYGQVTTPSISYSKRLAVVHVTSASFTAHSHTRCAGMEWDRMGCAVGCDAMVCFFMYMNIYMHKTGGLDDALLSATLAYSELMHTNLYWSLIGSSYE